MYIGADFMPVDQAENATYGVDFVNDLPSGDSIASVLSVTCTVAPDSQVIDPNPSGRILAGPFLSGSQVTVRISGIVANCKYILTFTVMTVDSNTLVLWTHMPGESIV